MLFDVRLGSSYGLSWPLVFLREANTRRKEIRQRSNQCIWESCIVISQPLYKFSLSIAVSQPKLAVASTSPAAKIRSLTLAYDFGSSLRVWEGERNTKKRPRTSAKYSLELGHCKPVSKLTKAKHDSEARETARIDGRLSFRSAKMSGVPTPC